MEYHQLGNSGLRVSELGFGAGTFGGIGDLFSAWGANDVAQAREIVDICLDAGVDLFDSADVYSDGASEEILGQAIKGRRDKLLIATKAALPTGNGALDWGTSRRRLIASVDAALGRLGTDYIDLFQLHGYDASTPTEETISALNRLIDAGKIRYIGVSNYPSWQLMKSLDSAEQHGWDRYVSHQVYYSLVGRDYEWDLMPLAASEGVGAIVWSPLGWGRLTGKIRRDTPVPSDSRLPATAKFGPPVNQDILFNTVDVLLEIAAETGKSVPQIALNWILGKPTISSVLIGARNANQLRDNLGATGWRLAADQVERLNAISATNPPYPQFAYHKQEGFRTLNPPL
ncbi:aldo/keto reductase [Renibacterium salmoninarum]|nr:aldo/keto reductase [Renibacterium salmoninarum]